MGIKIKLLASGLKDSGNLGALARLCDNFGVDELILISPECEVDDRAYQRATRSRRFLDNLKIVGSIEESLEHVDFLLGFTGKLGAKRKIAMKPVSLHSLHRYIQDYTNGTLGLLFGNESSGLSKGELAQCDLLTIIPTYGDNPILNITHSAAIGLYEVRKVNSEVLDDNAGLEMIKSSEKQKLFQFVERAVNASNIKEEYKESISMIFRNTFRRTFASPREIRGLIGMFRQLAESLEEPMVRDD